MAETVDETSGEVVADGEQERTGAKSAPAGAAADSGQDEVRAGSEPAGPEPETTGGEVADLGTDSAMGEADLVGDTRAADADSYAAASAGTGRPAPGRRLVVLLGAAVAILAVLAAVLAVGWVRTNDDLRRSDAAARTEQNRLRAELDSVAARRGELERDLAAAQKQALDPASRAAIEKCVRQYAEFERQLQEMLANGSAIQLRPDAPGVQSDTYVRALPGSAVVVEDTCIKAATHLPG